MLRYTFPAFMIFSFGIIFYGAVMDFIFSSIASKFYFYTTHENVLELLLYLCLGAFFCYFGRRFSIFFNRVRGSSDFELERIYQFVKIKGPLLGCLCGIFFFSFDGVSSLPERVGYRVDGELVVSTLYAVSGMFGLLCIPLLGLAWSSKNVAVKSIAATVFLLVLLCFFAKASRSFVLAPIVYSLVAYYSGAKFFKNILIFSIFLVPISTSFIYELRGQHFQGFIPFIYFILEGRSEYTLYELFSDFFISFSSGFYIFIQTANDAVWMGFDDLWVSINPQFGSASGWGNVFEEYRIGDAVPYSSLGELLAYSYYLFYLFCFFLGLVFGRAECNVRSGRLFGVAQIVILIYMAILMPQYNLRSVFRFFYLVLAIEFIIVIKYFVMDLLVRKKIRIGVK